MGSNQLGFLSPQGTSGPSANNWYSVKAATNNTAEIWLYDEIGGWGVTAKRFANELKALGNVTHIDLHIHSPGGDTTEGMAIYNLLKNHPATKHVFIGGLAASMGSVIAMVGNVVYAPENALVMVHNPWGIQGGDAEDMRKFADLLDRVEIGIVSAYTSKTGKSEEEIRALMKAETWMTGAEAVAAGFADKTTAAITAAASLTSKRFEEYTNMPMAAQQYFKPQGNAGQAPQPVPAAPQAAAPAAQPATPPAPATPQAAAPTMAAFQAQEQERRTAIQAAFKGFEESQATLLSACMLDMNVTASAAKDQLLAALGAGTTATGTAYVHACNGNIVGDSVKAAILARAGMGELHADNQFNGMTLAEMARASLEHRGIGLAGQNRMNIVGMAFTHSSSDFGELLADVAHKSVLKGYEEAGETFQQWTSKGRLSDFKPEKRVDLSVFPSLDKIEEGAEYKYGTVGDRAESIALATYGKLFSISRQAIINDDLSMLTRIPRLMGRAAIRTVGDLVYAILTKNVKMSDGKTLFHADHNNLMTAADLSVESIGKAMTAMQLQKENDAVLNILPAILLTGVTDYATAKSLLLAKYDPAQPGAEVPNPIRDTLEVIRDARLDHSGVNASFLLADGSLYDTIEVAYLDGNDKPYLEQEQGFTRDGAAFKVRIDAGVAPLSYRTMSKLPRK